MRTRSMLLTSVLLLTLTLSGCGKSGIGNAVVARDLPSKPGYMKPVGNAPIRKAQSIHLIAREARDRVELSDCRMEAASKWYDSVQRHYATGGKEPIITRHQCGPLPSRQLPEVRQ